MQVKLYKDKTQLFEITYEKFENLIMQIAVRAYP